MKITKDGGLVEIKGTNVSLHVPPGALLEDREINLQIITGNLDTGDDVTFASNSAAIVELTPDNFEFQTAVVLRLPHCLTFTKNFTKDSVEILTSHHTILRKCTLSFSHSPNVMICPFNITVRI